MVSELQQSVKLKFSTAIIPYILEWPLSCDDGNLSEEQTLIWSGLETLSLHYDRVAMGTSQAVDQVAGFMVQ